MKSSRFTMEFQKLINSDNRFEDLVEKTITDNGATRLSKIVSSIFGNESERALRLVKEKIKKFPVKITKNTTESDFSDIDLFYVITVGYVVIDGLLISQKDREKYINNFYKGLNVNGYEYKPKWLDEKFTYSKGDLVFKTKFDVFKFIFDTSPDLKFITVDNNLLDMIRNYFDINFESVRAVIASLERQDYLIKADANVFHKTLDKDKFISKEIYKRVLAIDNTTIPKNVLYDEIADLIVDYNLILDMPYYMLRRAYNRAENKNWAKHFAFSTGNSMAIFKDSNLRGMKMIERIEAKFSNPAIIPFDVLKSEFGGTDFTVQNHKELYWTIKREGVLYFDIDIHKSLVENDLRDFFEDNIGIAVSPTKFLHFIELSDNRFLRMISTTMSKNEIIRRILGNDIKRDINRNFYYKSSSSKIVDVDDWSDF